MIVEGQVHGGIAQGVGQALLEGARLRRRRPARDGELHGLHHAARRRPVLRCRHDRDAVPVNPLGIKGCGEAGAIGSPPAVINAITDALGHEDIAMPATPRGMARGAEERAGWLRSNSRGHPGQAAKQRRSGSMPEPFRHGSGSASLRPG
jgi:carbon-monoxide dehydrogenase large subunit